MTGNRGIPETYRGRLLTLEAFGADRKLLAEVRASESQEEKIAEQLFANQDVKYIQVRSTEAGCFLVSFGAKLKGRYIRVEMRDPP